MAFREFLKRHKLFIIYNLFGFSATLLETLLYWFLYHQAGVSNIGSTLMSWIITVVYAFFTNKIFVYKSRFWRPTSVILEFFSFFGFRAVTGIYNVFHMWITVDVLALWPVPMKVISALLVGLMNYALGKGVVFKRGMEKTAETDSKCCD